MDGVALLNEGPLGPRSTINLLRGVDRLRCFTRLFRLRFTTRIQHLRITLDELYLKRLDLRWYYEPPYI